MITWDGMPMGRTIAMKLTDKEERIINKLNRAGITNSEILRDALWQYFKTISEETTMEHPSLPRPEQNMSPLIQEYITHLKEEIQELRTQNIHFQRQIGEEISRLHGQLYRVSRKGEETRLTPSNQTIQENDTDVHSDIDELLFKKDTKSPVSL